MPIGGLAHPCLPGPVARAPRRLRSSICARSRSAQRSRTEGAVFGVHGRFWQIGQLIQVFRLIRSANGAFVPACGCSSMWPSGVQPTRVVSILSDLNGPHAGPPRWICALFWALGARSTHDLSAQTRASARRAAGPACAGNVGLEPRRHGGIRASVHIHGHQRTRGLYEDGGSAARAVRAMPARSARSTQSPRSPERWPVSLPVAPGQIMRPVAFDQRLGPVPSSPIHLIGKREHGCPHPRPIASVVCLRTSGTQDQSMPTGQSPCGFMAASPDASRVSLHHGSTAADIDARRLGRDDHIARS